MNKLQKIIRNARRRLMTMAGQAWDVLRAFCWCACWSSRSRRNTNKEAHLTAAELTDDLWRASSPLPSEPGKFASERNKSIISICRRQAELEVGGNTYVVKLTAKEYSSANETHDLHMVKVTDIKKK